MVCDALPNVGSDVTPASVPGEKPALSGGTLLDGTYALVTFALYNGASDSTTYRKTAVFTGGSLKAAESRDGAADTFLSGTYSTAGSILTVDIECPLVVRLMLSYGATPTTLILSNPNNPDVLETSTKQ